MVQVDAAASQPNRLLSQAQSILGEPGKRLRALLEQVRTAQAQLLAEQRELAEAIEEARGRIHGQPADDSETGRLALSQLRRSEEELLARRDRSHNAANALRLAGWRIAVSLRHLESAQQVLSDTAAERATTASNRLIEERVIEAQENERQRLAREIHDGPAQILANGIFQLEYFERLARQRPTELAKELAGLKQDLRTGLTEVRHFIFDLRLPSLRDLGLRASLQRYTQELADRSGIQVELDCDEHFERLSDVQETTIFRIVQEALQNVRKHARASKAKVTLRHCGAGFVVTVEDDGAGFTVEAAGPRETKHFGLTSMRERAQLIGGELVVDSRANEGTRVTLRMPAESDEDAERSR
ncbi:MAG: sensor histidine kinase [Chloroflexi bacterium]|nr:sensor histidine kinase [Chloroflexota bacterium]